MMMGDSSEIEDDDGLIDPVETPIFEVSKIGKSNNHEIIDVSKTMIRTYAHTRGRKKRKSLPKIFHVFNFDDMPLGSPSNVGRNIIHGLKNQPITLILWLSKCVFVTSVWRTRIVRGWRREKRSKGKKKERKRL